MAKDDILVANKTFTVIDGKARHLFRKGKTRIHAGHPYVKGREADFDPIDVEYGIEQATAAPGEGRNAKVKP
jgi:hypothetical protein